MRYFLFLMLVLPAASLGCSSLDSIPRGSPFTCEIWDGDARINGDPWPLHIAVALYNKSSEPVRIRYLGKQPHGVPWPNQVYYWEVLDESGAQLTPRETLVPLKQYFKGQVFTTEVLPPATLCDVVIPPYRSWTFWAVIECNENPISDKIKLRVRIIGPQVCYDERGEEYFRLPSAESPWVEINLAPRKPEKSFQSNEKTAEKYRKVLEQYPDKKAAEEASKRYNEIMRKRKSQDKLKDEKSGE